MKNIEKRQDNQQFNERKSVQLDNNLNYFGLASYSSDSKCSVRSSVCRDMSLLFGNSCNKGVNTPFKSNWGNSITPDFVNFFGASPNFVIGNTNFDTHFLYKSFLFGFQLK